MKFGAHVHHLLFGWPEDECNYAGDRKFLCDMGKSDLQMAVVVDMRTQGNMISMTQEGKSLIRKINNCTNVIRTKLQKKKGWIHVDLCYESNKEKNADYVDNAIRDYSDDAISRWRNVLKHVPNSVFDPDRAVLCMSDVKPSNTVSLKEAVCSRAIKMIYGDTSGIIQIGSRVLTLTRAWNSTCTVPI